MKNPAFYTTVIAFAAAAALNAQAKAEEAGSADLMQLLQQDLDAERNAFTLALVERTGAKLNARMAKIDNVFVAPNAAPVDVAIENTRDEFEADLNATVLAKASFDISKKVANIETPFEPHLPMPMPSVAFVSEGQ